MDFLFHLERQMKTAIKPTMSLASKGKGVIIHQRKSIRQRVNFRNVIDYNFPISCIVRNGLNLHTSTIREHFAYKKKKLPVT